MVSSFQICRIISFLINLGRHVTTLHHSFILCKVWQIHWTPEYRTFDPVQGMQAHGKMWGIASLIPSLDTRGQWSLSRISHFISREITPSNHWTGNCLGSRASLDLLQRRQIGVGTRFLGYANSTLVYVSTELFQGTQEDSASYWSVCESVRACLYSINNSVNIQCTVFYVPFGAPVKGFYRN